MRKTTESSQYHKVTVDIYDLMDMLGVGRATAQKIGKNAGAELHVGRRRLYHVGKVENYLEKLTEN